MGKDAEVQGQGLLARTIPMEATCKSYLQFPFRKLPTSSSINTLPAELLFLSSSSHDHLLSSTMALSFLVLGAFAAQRMATMLYNGLQTQIFSSDLSTTCDAALNTSISCPEDIIQLTTYGIQAVGESTLSGTSWPM